MTVNICIVHFNTPKLTECLIRSINKFTPNSKIYIFDNSDKSPFTYRQDNIVYFDNTKGQIINFDKWLSGFPSKGVTINKYGSAKHSYTVQKCMDLIGDNFVLLDSDVLLRKDISPLYDEQYAYVGDEETWQGNYRVIPYCCFINTKFCTEHGISYFNERYVVGLTRGCRYDTGAYLWLKCKDFPHLKIRYRDYVVHLDDGSQKNDVRRQDKWLEEHRDLYIEPARREKDIENALEAKMDEKTDKKINICIIHYNTPKLTECLVKSINKFTPNSTVYIFDNSDKLPFTAKFDNVVVFNNTKGQYIDFNEWLKKYPNRLKSPGKLNGWGSAKHCYSVEKCMDIIGEDFILLDSDVILKKDISCLAEKKYIFVGEVINQPGSSIKRVLPYVCYINVPAAKTNHVHYFNENYMHGLRNYKTNKAADSYDTGAYFYLSSSRLPKREIKWEDYCVHYGSGSWIKEKRSDSKKTATKLSETEFLNNNKNLWETANNHMSDAKKKTDKVIYTCITGNYELLDDPFVLSPGYDYVCFTNSPLIKSHIWNIRPIPEELDGLSEVKKQRCIKINPHKYLPEYSLSIWVDGSVKLKKDVNLFVEQNCKNGNVFIPSHPQRTCIYKEMQACINQKKDTADRIAPQKERYRKEGFPENFGLVQSNIIIRRHNEPDCIKLMETWWTELKNGSHRDQLSFDYARWKNKDVKVVFLDKNTCKTPYFTWDPSHGKGRIKKAISEILYPSPTTPSQKASTKPTEIARPKSEKSTNGQVMNEEIRSKIEHSRQEKTVRTQNRVHVVPTVKRRMLSAGLKRFLSN